MDECGEDVFAPTIFAQTFFAITYNTWFTDPSDLLTAAETVYGQDDCSAVIFAAPVFTPDCKKSTVFLSASDRCNNTANTTIAVFFDDQPPRVVFSLAPVTGKAKILSLSPLVLVLSFSFSWLDISVSRNPFHSIPDLTITTRVMG